MGWGGNTVSGTARYEKKLYDDQGFTGQKPMLPIRFATVEVRGPSGAVLSTTQTDGAGRFCIAYVRPAEPGVNSVVVKSTSPDFKADVGRLGDISSALDETPVFRFSVYDQRAFFEESEEGGAFQVDVTAFATQQGGIFNILDTLIQGNSFFRAVAGKEPPQVTTVWQEEIPSTFFVPKEGCQSGILAGEVLGILGDCIFIRGDGQLFFGVPLGGDRDEYDDDIILHEYGHFLIHNFSRDNSPGGIHFLNGNDQDIRLAWSEGWATFLSSATRQNPVNVDVGVDGLPLFAFSIETTHLLFPVIFPDPLIDSAIYTTSEVAVGSVLWDIFDGLDPAAEPFDGLSLGFGPLWSIMDLWRDSPPPSTTMEAFWDSFGQVQPGFVPQLADLALDRRMEFFRDDCEMSDVCSASLITKAHDDTFEGATPVAVDAPSRHHTLFPEGDVDYMSFELDAGQSYLIRTYRLTNGADTLLELSYVNGENLEVPLRDSIGAPYQNDNPGDRVFHDGCQYITTAVDGDGNEQIVPAECPNDDTLAARVRVVEYVPPEDCNTQPCPIYARVRRSPQAPPSTGRLGTYNFSVDLQQP